MICFVTTRAHGYTHRRVAGWRAAPRTAVWSYDRLFAARRLPFATWVFTDFDRLSFWDLELAARAFRVLRHAGLRVLNDPARVRKRLALLRHFRQLGINRFGAWAVDGEDRPTADDYPVFLRGQSAHRGVIGALIHQPGELDGHIDHALAQGHPRCDLMIVQYAAEPLPGGLFRKMAVFRIGGRTVPALCVHQADWCVKDGTMGIATPANYAEEHAIVVANPYGDRLVPAFTAAEIDYGRADFGLVRGDIAVYEINTNPAIGRPMDHPSQVRVAAYELWRAHYLDALNAIDSPNGGGAIDLTDACFADQRRRDFPLVRSRWTP